MVHALRATIVVGVDVGDDPLEDDTQVRVLLMLGNPSTLVKVVVRAATLGALGTLLGGVDVVVVKDVAPAVLLQ